MSSDVVVDDVMSGRGRKAPRDNLRDAVEFLEAVFSSLGVGPFDRLALAAALGHETENGTSNRKVGTLTHFGLLQREGSAYRISRLGTAIVAPTDDGERGVAIAKAALEPNVYSAVYQEFAGQPLPRLLPNVLQRRFGIGVSVAEAAADRFRETMEYASLLKNGVLLSEPDLDGSATNRHDKDDHEADLKKSSQERPDVSATHQVASKSTVNSDRSFHVPLSKGRVAVLQLPMELDDGDIRRISGWIELMKDVLIAEPK